MKKKTKKGVRITAIILAALIFMTAFAGLFQANASDLNIPQEETPVTVISDIAEIVDSIEPGTTGNSDEETTANVIRIPDIKKDKFKASFALYDVTKADEVTVILEKDGKEFELVFTDKEDYFISTELPVGTYKVKEVETDERFVDVTIDIDTVEIKENDLQSFTISGTQKEANGFVQFLARNWFLLLGIIVLLIIYRRIIKKKQLAG